MITIRSAADIAKMRVSGQVVARILEILEKEVRPGINTGKLNAIAEEAAKKSGAIPVFKNYPHPHRYRPFPASICTSVNEEVIHGIPGRRLLHEGEIISIDFGVIVNGFAGDAAITVPVGQVDSEMNRLIRITRESLMKGINEARPGQHLGSISHAIQSWAEKEGFSVVRDFVGHGIGRRMHEPPAVPNYGSPDQGPVLKEGMTLAIEPMLNMGSYAVYTKADEWTVVTRDGKPSAHFEHSIVVGENGPEILTLR